MLLRLFLKGEGTHKTRQKGLQSNSAPILSLFSLYNALSAQWSYLVTPRKEEATVLSCLQRRSAVKNIYDSEKNVKVFWITFVSAFVISSPN